MYRQFKVWLLLVGTLILASCQSTQNVAVQKSDVDPKETAYHVTIMPIQYQDKQLYGQLYRPNTDKKVPLVIFSHELGNTHQTGERYARDLATRGYAVYIFDFSGGSISSQSSGSTRDMSILTEVSDLEAVVANLQQLDFIDDQKIILLGGSQGGVVSALTAARQPDTIAGLILLYPAFVISDEVHRMYSDVKDVPEQLQYLNFFPAGSKYVTDIWSMDFYDDIQNYKKDVLILHGTKDTLVDLRYSQKAQQSYDSATLQVIEGSGHSFLDDNFDIVVQYILTYLSNIVQDSISVSVNGQIFRMILDDTPAAKAFKERLPVTLTFRDVNNNEKASLLEQSLPVQSIAPETIRAGDIMLYRDNELVLFYETFQTQYQYTRIGKIEGTDNWKNSLGAGHVNVTFTLKEKK